jgi:hypothetical protein
VAILVDQPRWPAHGTHYAHLVSDASLDELRAFVGDRRLRFHRDHYDVPRHMWDEVVAAGATVVTAKEIVRRIRRR